jgi:CRP-like cAMP-binding protein/predicted MFS family arabinose efflux permease
MTMLASSAPPSAFAVFRKRSFTLLWIGRLISTSGSALTDLAAGILIYRMTGSALSVGLLLMVTALPSLILGLLAGVFADRFDRKRIMIASDLIRAALVVAIPFALSFGTVWLYIIVLLSSAVRQFFDPAHESVLPEVASDEELSAANALMEISSFGSTAIGFAAAGLIASSFPIEWAFYLDGLSFLISAICIALIRIAPFVAGDRTTAAAVVRDLRAGARFLLDSPILRSLLILFVPTFLSIGLANVLLLPFSLTVLHATEFEYGLQEGLTSVGFVVGSLLMARLADRLREGQWIAIGSLGMAAASFLYALSSSIPLAIVFVTISGFMNAQHAIGRRLAIQRNTTNEVRGRVSSAFFVTRDVVFLIGMAAAGLADLIGVQVLFLAAALVLLAAGALVQVMPGLRQSAAEWRQAMRLLRNAHAAPGLGLGRSATASDLDRLTTHLHALAGLSAEDRRHVLSQTRVYDMPAGAVIMRQGELSDAIFFVIEGRAVAGTDVNGSYRALGLLRSGDFFGEIAALTGTPRTATVMAQEPISVLGVPAATLRRLMRNPLINGVMLERMAERLARQRCRCAAWGWRSAYATHGSCQPLRDDAVAGPAKRIRNRTGSTGITCRVCDADYTGAAGIEWIGK